MLKENFDICCESLHDIFNDCIEHSMLSDDLKLADPTPIFKEVDRTSKTN